MSDTIIVALIAGSFNVLAVVIGRLLSHFEHKKTSAEVSEIKKLVNGGH